MEAGIILFGVRSPIAAEYEETCLRLNRKITHAVSLGGTPRIASRAGVVDIERFDPASAADPFIACAFAPKRRAALIVQARALGLILSAALIDPHAVLARSVRVGDGSFLNAGAIVGALTLIGDAVLINRAVSVGHHCVIGDHVSIGPGATLAGNIHVGNDTMIGAGSVILPDIRIGAGAIVAAGSLVRQHVPDGVFVAGNPAKLRKFDPERSSLYVEDGE